MISTNKCLETNKNICFGKGETKLDMPKYLALKNIAFFRSTSCERKVNDVKSSLPFTSKFTTTTKSSKNPKVGRPRLLAHRPAKSPLPLLSPRDDP